ncbi:ATP-binding protein [Nitratireductor sp. ZSWI3]|uniref:ATP-binding protein n=1 Tax=Nitratireductor sp. ZSWI3 TaxID=2966359 RepID=UPI00214FA7D0|nr:ATP-binding protein [Nitratireductor sp. ZSWI3]MCR4267135.1 ATP-binding protein [Nitratireductor sp. ZSWI3]
MFVERGTTEGETTSQERRASDQPQRRLLGHVVHCDGARATIAADAGTEDNTSGNHWTVGKMISINLGATRTVGLVYAVERPERRWSENEANPIAISVELIGEVRDGGSTPVFDRGITEYPHIGAPAHRIRSRDLQAVYDLNGRHSAVIGRLSQDEAIDACIAVDDTLNRHFAVVGTTGVGKSSAVALLLRKTIASRPDLRVLILDPHNEFAAALPEYAVRIDTTTLDLPFWLFRLEEFVEVLFRGREAVPEEVELLRDLIPHAKQIYQNPAAGGLLKRAGEASSITADTPVPYRMADVLKDIDERMGMLETKTDRPLYRSLRARIEAALNDPRYRFMFASRLIEDTIHETIGQIFRIPGQGKTVTCLEMAGMPPEVVNSVCSVLSRLAFDMALWSNGRLKLLVVCEEAHRYMPSDPRMGFAPTRHALARIAKEGRKYGCYLGVVTQRPGELDPTVLSQCSTVFAMRLANDQDQAIIRSAIADSSASTLSFLSAMGRREAIAFGEGVATTMRVKFEELPPDVVPATRQDGAAAVQRGQVDAEIDLASIVKRLRETGRTRTAPMRPNGEAAPSGLQAGDAGYEPTSGRISGSEARPLWSDEAHGQRGFSSPTVPSLNRNRFGNR